MDQALAAAGKAPGQRREMSWLREATVQHEPSLLRQPQLSAWAGFRVGIFQAISVEIAGQHGEHPALAMILKGRTRARIQSRGQECDFSPGPNSVGVFAPELEVSWTRWICEPGAERMMIELDYADLERAGDLDAMLPSRRALQQNLTLSDHRLASMMRLIAEEVREGSPHGTLYAGSLSLALAGYLFSEHAGGGRPAQRERGALTLTQKSRVLELIQQRLADELSLDDLAAAAGLSRFHFARLFKNTLGVTPHRFVQDQRLSAAKRLLEDTTMTLVDIAAQTGFSSQSHLCTAMQRHMGITPGRWRRAAMPFRCGAV